MCLMYTFIYVAAYVYGILMARLKEGRNRMAKAQGVAISVYFLIFM